jgi:phospholipid transport system substrate-binding protein
MKPYSLFSWLERTWTRRWVLSLGLLMAAGAQAQTFASTETPDSFISKLTNHLLDVVKADPALRAGDIPKINALVNTQVMPHVNFERMTASAVGPMWRQATPAQRQQLTEEFKILLVRSYAGALAQIKDQKVVVKKPRYAATDTEVLVRTEVRGSAEPLPIEYRLEKTTAPGGWRIYNLNVLGVWLVETYRSQFGSIASANGLDGLITTLRSRNNQAAAK